MKGLFRDRNACGGRLKGERIVYLFGLGEIGLNPVNSPLQKGAITDDR